MNRKSILTFINSFIAISFIVGLVVFTSHVIFNPDWKNDFVCVRWDLGESCIKKELEIIGLLRFYIGISSFGLSPFLALLILQIRKSSSSTNNRDTVDFSNTTTILVTGPTGSGKTVWTDSLYESLKKRYSEKDLGFFVADMTRVEFIDWTKDKYLVEPVVYKPEDGFRVFEEAIKRAKSGLLTVLHIEECDMVVEDQKRFEDLWQVASNTKDLITVFSTSRFAENMRKRILKDSKQIFSM